MSVLAAHKSHCPRRSMQDPVSAVTWAKSSKNEKKSGEDGRIAPQPGAFTRPSHFPSSFTIIID